MYDNEESLRNYETKLSFRQYLLPANTAQLNAPQSSYDKISLDILGAVGDRCVPLQRKGIMQQIINRYSRSPKMLRPDNIYLNVWELLVLLIIIYYILEIGMLVAFKQAFWQDEYQKVLGLQIFFVIVLVTDIAISPLKTYYDEGLLINEIPQILAKYIKIQFWIDVIGLIVIIVPLCVGSLSSNYGKILWFLKLYSARRINANMERETQLYISLNTIYLIVKLIVFCYFYAHFMGLGFYLTSLWVYNNNYYGPSTPNLCWIYNSWAYYQMVLLLPWTQMYAYIMYYSIAVVTTIAYGDITPKNPIECVYTIVALIIVTIIFGYLLTEILRLLINVFSYSFQRRFHHFELNTKLKLLFVSRQTQIQIKAHTQQIDKQEKYRNRQIEDKIMRFLPPDALYGLLLVIYRDFLIQLGFTFAAETLENTLRPSDYKSLFLDHLMKDIREQRHYVGDVFYKENDIYDEKPSSHCAYFYTNKSNANSVLLGIGKLALLRGGKLDTQKNILQKSFQLARAKSLFGQVQFLTGSGRSHWAICLQNCVLFLIPRSSLLQHYSLMTLQEREIFIAYKEKIDYLNCYLCGKDHNFKRCDLVFPFSDDVQQVHHKAKRIGKLRSLQRTRLKTMSSWILYKKIRDSKVKISKEYRQKLMLNKVNHELFVEYELDESEQSDDEFDYALHETEIIIDKVYNQQVDDMGYAVEQDYLQNFYNFSTYKVKGNIKVVSQNYRDYNAAKKQRRSS